MKFKSNIESQAGIEDSASSAGTAGQILSSLGPVAGVDGVGWIDQAEIVAAGATRVLIACKNTSGGTITKGTPVYQTGNVGATDVIEVAEADALISTGYLPAIGLLETDLINNAFGHVVITGELLNITTSPIDGVTPVTGDTIYLKSGGGLTLTKPTGEGNAVQNLGLVGKVSGGNAGSLTVASIMRQNDVPNLPEGRIWIGDGNTIVSDTVYVDEPNNRVGIGTTSPSTKLHISDVTTPEVRIQDTTANRYLSLYQNNSNSYIQSSLNSALVLSTHGANERMRITTAGNVGIGTTSPSAKLDVYGNLRLGTTGDFYITQSSFSTTQFYVTGGGNGGTITFGAPASNTQNVSVQGDLHSYQGSIGTKQFGSFNNKISYNGDNYLNSGNLGIGTTSPNSKLQVDGEIDANGGDGYRINGKPWAAESSNNLRLGDWDGEGFTTTIYDDTSAPVVLVGAGKVGIGTTSPQAKLQVNGGVQLANDTAGASASKVGTFRYRTSGNNSYVDMCMQTGASTYAWVNIVTNSW